MTQGTNAEAMILRIEAEASKCDYIAGCEVIKRMNQLEEAGVGKNIDKLLGIYGHIERCCNDKKHPQCEHFNNEMFKSYGIDFMS